MRRRGDEIRVRWSGAGLRTHASLLPCSARPLCSSAPSVSPLDRPDGACKLGVARRVGAPARPRAPPQRAALPPARQRTPRCRHVPTFALACAMGRKPPLGATDQAPRLPFLCSPSSPSFLFMSAKSFMLLCPLSAYARGSNDRGKCGGAARVGHYPRQS